MVTLHLSIPSGEMLMKSKQAATCVSKQKQNAILLKGDKGTSAISEHTVYRRYFAATWMHFVYGEPLHLTELEKAVTHTDKNTSTLIFCLQKGCKADTYSLTAGDGDFWHCGPAQHHYQGRPVAWPGGRLASPQGYPLSPPSRSLGCGSRRETGLGTWREKTWSGRKATSCPRYQNHKRWGPRCEAVCTCHRDGGLAEPQHEGPHCCLATFFQGTHEVLFFNGERQLKNRDFS